MGKIGKVATRHQAHKIGRFSMTEWDIIAVIIALVASGTLNIIAIRRNIVLERQLWQAKRRIAGLV